MPAVIDHMIKVPDAASLAAMHVLSERLGRRVGGSTGTNFHGVCQLASEMIRKNQTGSIVSIICDGGDRYASTYYNPDWLADAKIDIAPWADRLNRFLDGGALADSA
jgi:cysteine synthase A